MSSNKITFIIVGRNHLQSSPVAVHITFTYTNPRVENLSEMMLQYQMDGVIDHESPRVQRSVEGPACHQPLTCVCFNSRCINMCHVSHFMSAGREAQMGF